MKYMLPILMLGALLALTGCEKGTPGGPGTALPDSEQATVGQTDDTFSLDAPMMSTNITQGEAKDITIGIKRGTNFDQDVTLSFSDIPTGLTINPSTPVVSRADSETKLSVSAAADASIGDFTVKVTGRPTTGKSATADLKITVDQK